MKQKRILRALGNVHDKYIEELYAQEETEAPVRRSAKKVWLIAAIVALMICLLGCAIVLLKLDDLKLADGIVQEADAPEVTEVEALISLQGFAGSKNYQAAQEWYEFLQTYDPDSAILRSLSDQETMMPEDYWSYNCYTPEMTDKVDEICEKYHLNKQGMAKLFASEKDFYRTMRIDQIIREDAQAETQISPQYFYKTGSFMLSCDTKLTGEDSPWIYTIAYQFYCVMKTDFDDVFLNMGNLESYEQWSYTTGDGTEVLLALSPEKGLVIVDKPECFISMNILETRVGDILYGEQMMPRQALEAFADTFDFSFTPQPVRDADWEAVRTVSAPKEEAREEQKAE